MLRLLRRAATPPAPIRSLAVIAGVSLAVAACGSSAPSSSHKGSPSPKAGSAATVATTKVPGYGTVLASGKGAPLYLLSTDPSGASSCSGSCAKRWPPLTVSGKPSAGPGVNASLLSSFKRSDGSEQVAYSGQALYTHPGMSASAVAGTAADGGIWYLVSPSGKPIKSTTGSGY